MAADSTRLEEVQEVRSALGTVVHVGWFIVGSAVLTSRSVYGRNREHAVPRNFTSTAELLIADHGIARSRIART